MTRIDFESAVLEHGPHLNVRFKDGSELRGSVFETDPDDGGVLLEGQPWRMFWVAPREVASVRRTA